MRILSRRHRPAAPPQDTGDELTAELTASYWRAYDERVTAVSFGAMARELPGLIGRAVRLGWEASRPDTAAAITLNLVSGIFAGYALLATTGVLQALFAAGPTPHRVRAALPSLIVVAIATATRAGLQSAAGWAAVQAAAAGRPARRAAAARPDLAGGAGRVRRRPVQRRHAAGP